MGRGIALRIRWPVRIVVIGSLVIPGGFIGVIVVVIFVLVGSSFVLDPVGSCRPGIELRTWCRVIVRHSASSPAQEGIQDQPGEDRDAEPDDDEHQGGPAGERLLAGGVLGCERECQGECFHNSRLACSGTPG